MQWFEAVYQFAAENNQMFWVFKFIRLMFKMQNFLNFYKLICSIDTPF